MYSVGQKLSWNVPSRLSFPGMDKLVHWLKNVTDGGSQVKFVAWHELYVSFMITTHMRGLVRRPNAAWEALPPHTPFQFLHHCRSFSKYLQAVIRHLLPMWKAAWSKPANYMYCFWTGGVWMRPNLVMEEQWQKWMRARCATGVLERCAQLRDWPEATSEWEIPM